MCKCVRSQRDGSGSDALKFIEERCIDDGHQIILHMLVRALNI